MLLNVQAEKCRLKGIRSHSLSGFIEFRYLFLLAIRRVHGCKARLPLTAAMLAFEAAGRWLIKPWLAEVLDLDGSTNELDGAGGSSNR